MKRSKSRKILSIMFVAVMFFSLISNVYANTGSGQGSLTFRDSKGHWAEKTITEYAKRFFEMLPGRYLPP